MTGGRPTRAAARRRRRRRWRPSRSAGRSGSASAAVSSPTEQPTSRASAVAPRGQHRRASGRTCAARTSGCASTTGPRSAAYDRRSRTPGSLIANTTSRVPVEVAPASSGGRTAASVGAGPSGPTWVTNQATAARFGSPHWRLGSGTRRARSHGTRASSGWPSARSRPGSARHGNSERARRPSGRPADRLVVGMGVPGPRCDRPRRGRQRRPAGRGQRRLLGRQSGVREAQPDHPARSTPSAARAPRGRLVGPATGELARRRHAWSPGWLASPSVTATRSSRTRPRPARQQPAHAEDLVVGVRAQTTTLPKRGAEVQSGQSGPGGRRRPRPASRPRRSPAPAIAVTTYGSVALIPVAPARRVAERGEVPLAVVLAQVDGEVGDPRRVLRPRGRAARPRAPGRPPSTSSAARQRWRGPHAGRAAARADSVLGIGVHLPAAATPAARRRRAAPGHRPRCASACGPAVRPTPRRPCVAVGPRRLPGHRPPRPRPPRCRRCQKPAR